MELEKNNEIYKRNWTITLFLILIGSIAISCGVYINGFLGDLFPFMVSVNFSYWITHPKLPLNKIRLNPAFPVRTLLRLLILNTILYMFAIVWDYLFKARLTSLVVIENIRPYLLGQIIAFSVADLLHRLSVNMETL